MSQAVLNSKSTIVAQRSICPLSISKLNSETELHKMVIFDNIIKDKIGDAMTRPNKPPPSAFIHYSDGDLDPPDLHEVYEYTFQTDGTAVFEQPITDHWIYAELSLPQG